MPLVVEPEKCHVCGCTELNPCIIDPLFPFDGTSGQKEPCTWLDFDHTLCTNPRCVASVPLDELLAMPIFRGVIR